jgi:hypothetical protein
VRFYSKYCRDQRIWEAGLPTRICLNGIRNNGGTL